MGCFTAAISSLQKVRKALSQLSNSLLCVGLAIVYGKFLQSAYGYCPRAFCDKQRVVPNGLSDVLRQNRVKVYCPKCEEMYIPQGSNRLDGAYFGSSLAHLFFETYSKVIVLPPKVYFYEP